MKQAFPTDARPSAPEWLSRAGATIWSEIVNSLPADYFRASDLPLLASYCTSTAHYIEAAQTLERDGMFLVNNRGTEYAHPANSVMLQHAASMAQLGTKLRLTPQARIAKGEKKPTGLAGGGGRRPWGNQEVA